MQDGKTYNGKPLRAKLTRKINCLRDLMWTLSTQVYDALQERIGFDMKPFKKYIDNEILVTIAQMDKPSKIFDYLYLVSKH